MPSLFSAQPIRPISARPKICQMVPTTFHGISSGMAIRIRHSDAQRPRVGMHKAMAMPSGIWISSTQAEKMNWRSSESCRRGSCNTWRYQSTPTK